MRYDGNHQNLKCVLDLQQVEQPRVFLNNLKLRMIAESDNICKQTLQASNRYFIDNNFEQSRYKEMYLNHIKPVYSNKETAISLYNGCKCHSDS